MKTFLPLFAALGLTALAALVPSAQAGSAVAGDGHGGFGYSYGPRPERVLRREAIERCREKSRFPDDVEIVYSTSAQGAGVIVRYRNEGRQYIFAYVGADSPGEAHRHAMEGARRKGADEHPEVVARWVDE